LGFRATQYAPALESLIERDAAFSMLFALLIAGAAGRALSVSDLSRRFAVSRSHVLSVMREAQGNGFVAQDMAGGAYAATAAMTTALRPFFALLAMAEWKAMEQALQIAGM
jgi:DNA-binding transcriptional regulator GbsR (MarR family)